MGDDWADVSTEMPQRLRGLTSWLLNQARVVGDRQVSARFGGAGGRTEFAVLAALDEFGELSQADIGRRIGLDRSDVVALLNRLEGDGVLTREQDSHDRRRNIVTITAKGRKNLAQMDIEVRRAQDDLLEPLGPGERATLISLLQRVLDHQRGI